VAGDLENTFPLPPINARDKHVVVIGGGDTGSDCVGTSIRQGAKSVHQLEIMPKPPEGYNETTPWPAWPIILRTSSSHLEGCERRWSTSTKELRGENGHVKELVACEVEWEKTDKGWKMQEKPGTDFTLSADLVILAMGFLHVDPTGLVEEFQLDLDPRGNIVTQDQTTSAPGVFAAGDAQRGASLVVHAINDGRKAAEAIHRYVTRK
jgi:glutamate synthase (NADPH/NADH) small chain